VEVRYTYRVFMGEKPEGQRLLEGPRCSQEGNIKMAVRQIRSEGVNTAVYLAQCKEK
jgi:hypothetical protein